MTQKLLRVLRYLLPLLLGAGLLWILYRDVDLGQIRMVWQEGVSVAPLLLSCLMGTVGNLFRGLRWYQLLRAVDHRPTLWQSQLCVHGNYAVNMVVPRLGEVWRCGAMAHMAPISFGQAVGTLIVDRSTDILIMLVVIAMALVVNYPFFRSFFIAHPDVVERASGVVSSPWLFVAIGLVLVVLCGVLYLLVQRGQLDRLQRILGGVWGGLRSVRQLEHPWRFGLLSLLIWISYFMQMYLPFFAFDFTQGLSVVVALLAFALATIAVAAPVQAGMGAWHFMVIYTLVFFGVGDEDAAAFALIVHTSQTLWTTVVGAVAVLLVHLHKRQ